MLTARATVLALGVSLALAGCGDLIAPTAPQLPETVFNSMSATINGIAWNGTLLQASRTSTHVLVGGGNAAWVVSIIVPISGTSAFTLGATSTATAAVGSLSGDQWSASAPGGSGTVTIASMTTTRVVGTFAFDAAPSTTLAGNAAGTVHVVSGKFDVQF